MTFQENNDDVVVFFDFENIVYSLRNMLGENPNFELLMDKCQEYGRIVLARAYADWSRHNTVIAPLQASGFDPVYVPTYFYEDKERKARKNAVDIHIAIEAIEVMYTQPHINTFILLTGDKDFIPLANALRRHGKTVIAVGVQGTTSPYMRQATDDFVFYHQLQVEPKSRKRKQLQRDIYSVLVEAVEKIQSDDQKPVFPLVKHTMSEIMGSFDEKDYTDSKGANFSRFKDFILEAQRLGHVRLVTTGSVNEVLLPGQVSQTEEEAVESEPEEEEKPSTPEITDTESAFELLVWAVNHARAEEKSPRTSSIKTIMRSSNPGFDEKQLKNVDGEFFAKFSDFAREAAGKGLVRIEGKGIRMEIHPAEGKTSTDEGQNDSAVHSPPEEAQPLVEEEPPPAEQEPVSLEAQAPETDESPPTEALIPLAAAQEIPEGQDSPEDSTDEAANPPQDTNTYASDYRMRVLVIDALRNCEYPAPAHVIGQQCIETSQQRGVTLPNRRLNQLLTSARDKGLLREISDSDADIKEYIFVESSQAIKLFLDDET